MHTGAVGTVAYSNYVAPPDPVSVSGRGGRAQWDRLPRLPAGRQVTSLLALLNTLKNNHPSN